jgi:hypothetical protein
VPIAGIPSGSVGVRVGFGPGTIGGTLMVWPEPFVIQAGVPRHAEEAPAQSSRRHSTASCSSDVFGRAVV